MLLQVPHIRGQAALLMGDAYTDLRDADKARRAYEDALHANAAAPALLAEAAFKLGRNLYDQGKRGPAREALQRARRQSCSKR